MSATDAIPIGATGTFSMVVRPELTVRHWDPSGPAVFGTPFMILAMEAAANHAIAPYLPAGWASVGYEVNVRHIAATALGDTVTATATVTCKTARRITLAISARNAAEPIGEGTHVRAPVEVARLERGAAARRAG